MVIDRNRAVWQSPERRHGGLSYATVLLNGRSGGHAGPGGLVSSRDRDACRPTPRGGSVMEVPFGGWKAPRRTAGPVPEAYSGLSSAPARPAAVSRRASGSDGRLGRCTM